MKKIGVKEVPVKNPKRIVKPIELPDKLKPKSTPVEFPIPVQVPAIPVEVPKWQSPGS